MSEFRLYLIQRITALIMVPLVLGHLIVIVIAIQGGLTVGEILSRTQGSIFWAVFYGLFVGAVSIHAAIGVRNIAQEWLGLGGKLLSGLSLAFAFALLWMGLSAVWAVTA
ncbi:MAG: succinate dehydrogenase [Pseudomonadota bacterium]